MATRQYRPRLNASWLSSVHSLRATPETIEFGLTWHLAAGWGTCLMSSARNVNTFIATRPLGAAVHATLSHKSSCSAYGAPIVGGRGGIGRRAQGARARQQGVRACREAVLTTEPDGLARPKGREGKGAHLVA